MKDLSFQHLVQQSLMEQHLLEIFNEKDFISLNLPAYTYPCILQGLPRDLDINSQNFLQLKAGFSDLNVLKTRIIDKPLLHLFHEKSSTADELIIFITYVVPGGFGDFFSQRHLKKILKERFVNIQTHAFIFLESSYCKKVTPLKDETIIPFSSQESLHPNYFDRSILSILKKAFLVFEIPTPYPYRQELQNLLPSSTFFFSIGEYGYIQSQTYQPLSAARCLGLHFLEYGLFIDEVKTTSIDRLSRQDLLSYLLGSTSRSCYFESHDLYFSYLATDYGAIFYFYLIIHLSLDSHKTIDLVCIDIGPYLKIIEQDLENLKSLPIKTLEIFYKNNRSIINISGQGLNVRIVHTDHLPHQDFQILLQASQEPVGIRGNLSFSEALSLKKLFFYDPLSHNYPLYYELLSLAKIHNEKVFMWMQLFKPQLDPKKAAMKGALLLKEKKMKESFKDLCCFILQNLKAEEHMINIVHKALFENKVPVIKKKEQDLTALFLEEKISFSMLIQAMEKEINS